MPSQRELYMAWQENLYKELDKLPDNATEKDGDKAMKKVNKHKSTKALLESVNKPVNKGFQPTGKSFI